MKQPAFVKLLQDSSHNSTMNTITRIIKCVLHFNVEMHIFSYCEWPDDDDEKCKKLKSSKAFEHIHSVRNLLLLKFAVHVPKKETRKIIELFSVCFDSCWTEKEKTNENVCINSVREAILESQKKYCFTAIKLFRILSQVRADGFSSALAEIKFIIKLAFSAWYCRHLSLLKINQSLMEAVRESDQNFIERSVF